MLSAIFAVTLLSERFNIPTTDIPVLPVVAPFLLAFEVMPTSDSMLLKFVARTVRFFELTTDFVPSSAAIIKASVSVLFVLFKSMYNCSSSTRILTRLSLVKFTAFSFVETATTSTSPLVTFRVEPLTMAFDTVSVPVAYIPIGIINASTLLLASKFEDAAVDISTFLASLAFAFIVDFSKVTVAELLAPSNPLYVPVLKYSEI